MTAQRVSTGIAGVDRVLNGGLIPRRTYLLVGAAGTDKTILSLLELYPDKFLHLVREHLGDFETELRKLTITSEGLEVSGKLDHLRGVLTGMPDYAEVSGET